MSNFFCGFAFFPLFLILNTNKLYGRGEQYLALSIGTVSSNQMHDLGGPLSGLMSFPYSISDALYGTYKRHFSDRNMFGCSFGIDNITGNTSYGNPKDGPFSGKLNIYYNTGVYKRKSYTIGFEYTHIYHKFQKHYTYAYIAAGLTYGIANYHFYQGIAFADMFYGPNGFVPSNPYTQHYNYFNGQITPIAISWGNDLAFFMEFGFGYKGIMNLGLSYKLKNRKSH